MGLSRSTDCTDLGNVALPYNVLAKELDDQPRLVAGSNMYGTVNEMLAKRPGFTRYMNLPHMVAGRIDRLLFYETEETEPQVLILASAWNPATSAWSVQWINADASFPVWTNAGDASSPVGITGIGSSLRPHEMVLHKGKVYIKSFPSAADHYYGTSVFSYSGTTPVLHHWGIVGPTQPARITDPAGWDAAAHAVDVRIGWKYAYSWENQAGQISSRSPLETDPDEQQSTTGAFTNKIPEVTLQRTAGADQQSIQMPYIIVWRTLDGGGNYLFLERVAISAGGNFDYRDDERSSSSGDEDPQSDAMLDSANIAPSETSNAPPPPVSDPRVAGTDAIEKSSNIVSAQGRLWYAIRGVLFFSGLEEINNGLPEHCWPSGFTGNYIPIGETTVALDLSPLGLVRFSNKHVYVTTGFNRESFAETRMLANSGMPAFHPDAHVSYQDVVFWLTGDFRVCALVGNQLVVLSKELGDEIVTRLNATTSAGGVYANGSREISFAAWAEQEKQYLFVLLRDKTTPANSIIWAYDLVRKAWNPPWTVQLSAIAAGRPRKGSEREELLGSFYDGSSSVLVKLDFTTKRDYSFSAGANVDYACSAETSLMRVPVGNHMNPLRRPVVVPDIMGFILQRTKFASDTAPTVEYRKDATSGSFTTLTPLTDPPRRPQSTGYSEDWYMLNAAGQRVALKVSKAAVNEDFELQNLAFIFRPEQGA